MRRWVDSDLLQLGPGSQLSVATVTRPPARSRWQWHHGPPKGQLGSCRSDRSSAILTDPDSLHSLSLCFSLSLIPAFSHSFAQLGGMIQRFFSSFALCAHTSILMGSVAPLLYIPGTFLLTQTHEIRVVKSWTTLPWDCKARLLLMIANVCFPQFAYLTQAANKAHLKIKGWISQKKQDQVLFHVSFKGGKKKKFCTDGWRCVKAVNYQSDH